MFALTSTYSVKFHTHVLTSLIADVSFTLIKRMQHARQLLPDGRSLNCYVATNYHVVYTRNCVPVERRKSVFFFENENYIRAISRWEKGQRFFSLSLSLFRLTKRDAHLIYFFFFVSFNLIFTMLIRKSNREYLFPWKWYYRGF